MKYVSIDLETTCLGPAQPEHILMVAMMVEDTDKKLPREEIPTFACFVKRDRYDGTPFALWLNGWIFEALAKNDQSKYPIYDPVEWVNKAQDFLNEHFPDTKAVAAGKNVAGFDLQFFPEKLKRKFIHRCIDPGSLFIDWSEDKPGSLDDIKKKLEIEGEVTHDAVDDAWDVIQVLRTAY